MGVVPPSSGVDHRSEGEKYISKCVKCECNV